MRRKKRLATHSARKPRGEASNKKHKKVYDTGGKKGGVKGKEKGDKQKSKSHLFPFLTVCNVQMVRAKTENRRDPRGIDRASGTKGRMKDWESEKGNWIIDLGTGASQGKN